MVINALPYIAVLLAMSLLIKPYAEKCPTIGVKQFYLNGARQINYRFMLIILAYIIYIVFSIFRKIEFSGEFNIGGTDAAGYADYFAGAVAPYLEYIKITPMEKGFTTINWILRQFTSSYIFNLLFWHTLTFVLTIKFFQYLKFDKYSIFAGLLILTNLISQFNTLRMSIGIAIGLIVLINLGKKKWLKALTLIIIAITIHNSGVILIPVWIVCLLIDKWNQFPIRKLVIYIGLGIIVSIFAIKIVTIIFASSPKYEFYLGEKSSVAWGTDIAVFAIFVLSILKYREMIEINPFNKILILTLPVCLICIPLQYEISIIYRMTMYFMPVLFALIPSLFKCYSKVRYSVSSIGIKVVLYGYMVFRTYSFFIEEGKYIGLPYVSILF